MPGSKPEFVADLNHQTLADLATQHQEPFEDHGCSENRASEMVLNRLLAGAVSSKKCVTNVIICGWEPRSPFFGGVEKSYMRSSTSFVVQFDQGHRHSLKYGGFLKWGYPGTPIII